MFETHKNEKGIFDLITTNWSEDQKKRAQEECKNLLAKPKVDKPKPDMSEPK